MKYRSATSTILFRCLLEIKVIILSVSKRVVITECANLECDVDPLIKKLTRLRGVGVVLATRFRDAGLDSFEKIVEAGADGLQKIRGINPRAILAILAQASEMVAERTENAVEQSLNKASVLRVRIQDVAEDVRSRFGPEMKGKIGKKVEKELLKIVDHLDQASRAIQKKKVVRGLVKAEKRLVISEKAGLKKVRRCLKKTRKALTRISIHR
ncbi:MAG: helix-hairpin-helix domain-containing protein [Geobacter sp.]|nr:MAG: helix-hairpin-helix domain-containing protein [Geobacter sp.]